jgi:YidC/Oxa1 family membrane protein insertase
VTQGRHKDGAMIVGTLQELFKMPSLIPLNRVSAVLHIFLILSLSSLTVEANQSSSNQLHYAHRIQSQFFDIAWLSDNPEPVFWKVLSGNNGDTSEWFSMQVPTDANRSITRHLSLNGEISNFPISSNGKWVHIDNKTHPQTIYRRPLKNGLFLEQSYALTNNPYQLNFCIRLLNTSDQVFKPYPDDRLQLSIGPGLGDQRSDGFGYADAMYSFVEPVALIDGEVKSFRPKPETTTLLPWARSELLWLGLHGRYFAFLIAPITQQNEKAENRFDEVMVRTPEYGTDTELPINHLPVLAMQLPLTSIGAGDYVRWEFVVFSGPKSMQALNNGIMEFDRLVFANLWQWMRWLSFCLLWLMKIMYSAIANWGFVILLLAVLVRIVLYPVARKAESSQKAFVQIQKSMKPELEKIKKDYRGEEQSERILTLYKHHGVSPLAGLKPLFIVLLQLPILIALFHVLGSAYELRDASFCWIETLAEPDKLFALGFQIPFLGEHFNILPVLMSLSTLIALKLSPKSATDASAERRQNIVLVFVALGFFILFYPFPAGLVLYWTAANVLHIIQQKFS